MKKLKDFFKINTWFYWVLVSFFLLSVLIIIIFPKNIYVEHEDNDSVSACACFGNSFSYGTKCIGFAYDCRDEEKTISENTCPLRSCSELVDMFSIISSQKTFQELQESKRGTDVILMIDTSNSMEGAKIAAAKQAAISLVQKIEESERIAIITFSEDAIVVQDFSSDKEQITSAINNITLRGGTKYLPALITAEKLFSDQNKVSKKGIIFLSDGTPADDLKKIVDKTRSLQKEGVILFTISFGFDVEEEENILSLMTPFQNDDREEGWYQSFRGSEDITQAFFEAWQDIKKIPIISIIPILEREIFSINQSKELGFILRVDNTLITQKHFPDTLCIPQINLDVSFNNYESNITSTQNLSTNNHIFYVQEPLLPGNYSLEAKAYIAQKDGLNCVFVGETTIDSIIIVEEAECSQSSCRETTGLLEDFSLAISSGAYLPREKGVGNVAIVVDRSESVSRYSRQILEGVQLINGLLNPLDKRSLIVFNEEANMIVPFTSDKNEINNFLSEGTDGVFNPQGTTKLLPVFEKMNYLFVDENNVDEENNIMLILTDGLPYDKEGFSKILSDAKELIDNNVCTYIFAYGSNILDNSEINNLFRSIGDYSESKLFCGGYVYSPSATEISSVVKHMFGSLKSLNEKVDETSIEITNSYTVLNDGSLQVSARIVSSLTGVSLPLEQKVSEFVCVDKPTINISLSNKKDSVNLLVNEQDALYLALSDPLSPGKYLLSLSASLSSQDCVMSDELEQTIIILGSERKSSSFIVILTLLSCIILLYFLFRKMRKALQNTKNLKKNT